MYIPNPQGQTVIHRLVQCSMYDVTTPRDIFDFSYQIKINVKQFKLMLPITTTLYSKRLVPPNQCAKLFKNMSN